MPGYLAAATIPLNRKGSRVFDGPDPCINVFCQSPYRLPCTAYRNHGQVFAYWLGHKIEIASQLAVILAFKLWKILLFESTNHVKRFAVTFSTVLEIDVERRLFARTVTRRQVKNEASVGELRRLTQAVL
jgi:hypothetical protein